MAPKLNTLTLKQRLAALSLSTSSPSSPRFQNFSATQPGSTLSSSSAKFTPPWLKKQRSQEPISAVYHDEETIQSVLVKMIFQAGVDYETRPMVVINASALPDPQTLNYDILLARILAYLNLYVESDYTVVFFAAGGRHTPGWHWLWKAYRSLSRKYRKNLKQLYIVHSSFFTKMLFSLAGAMISPKFFRKIIYIETLSELAHHVPITQIDIPPAVYKENAKLEEKITLPVPVKSNIFGLPLEELMGFYGEKGGIPRVVRDSIQYLRETALEKEGLFRHSAQSSVLRAAQEAYDRGNIVSLHTFGDPNIAAVLLKKFLRDLPEPIFPERLYPLIQQCPPPGNGSDASSVHYIREMLFPELAPCAYILLSQVLHLMHDVSLRSSVNKMDAHNLAIVLTPNLVQGKNPIQDASIFSVGPALVPIAPQALGSPTEANGNTPSTTLGMVIKLCIQRYYEIFDDVHDLAEGAIPSIDSVGLTMRDESTGTVGSSSLLDGSTAVEGEEEEEIDDEMLVMPIGPGHSRNGSALQGSGEKVVPWDKQKAGPNTLPSSPVLPSSPSSPSPPSTMDTPEVASGDAVTRTGGRVPYPTYSTLSKSKAKSVIGIEKGGAKDGKRRGSISVGRSGTGKSPGSGVEELGITAAGFFSPPGLRP